MWMDIKTLTKTYVENANYYFQLNSYLYRLQII